ncbi:hypothetical protein MJO28_016913, partial [Puccinia striiformis f. sp. tritici]
SAPPESHHPIKFNTPTTNLWPRQANTTYSLRPIPSHSMLNVRHLTWIVSKPLRSPNYLCQHIRLTQSSLPNTRVLKSHSQQLAELCRAST